ncbi:hypothetical protein J6590_003388 [Homalodisca vitripennis]|nr:hypothetical protein J6590_003388 [Homalodisca vitripennis]
MTTRVVVVAIKSTRTRQPLASSHRVMSSTVFVPFVWSPHPTVEGNVQQPSRRCGAVDSAATITEDLFQSTSSLSYVNRNLTIAVHTFAVQFKFENKACSSEPIVATCKL